MDEYLKPNSSFSKLWEEYHEYGRLVIAYDFNNTVYDFHQTGATYGMVIELLRELKKLGCIIICFTASEKPCRAIASIFRIITINATYKCQQQRKSFTGYVILQASKDYGTT